MFNRRSIVPGAMVCLFSACFAQQAPRASSGPALHEFALTLQQGSESGKTPIGTKIQAKLAVPTLFHGKVIPRNALFTGVVIESTAKSAKEAAKLAIRMESAEWKDGSTTLTAYLLPLYYTTTFQPSQGPPNDSSDPLSKNVNDAGQDANSPMHPQFPTNDSQAAIPTIPTTSSRPVRMKDVEFALADEGGAALVSSRGNIKLSKMTTYMFASSEAAGQ